jgi:hypothetical protein
MMISRKKVVDDLLDAAKRPDPGARAVIEVNYPIRDC